MAILLIGSVLLGAVLGRFFKVLVLVPAGAFVLAAVLVGSADVAHDPLRPLLVFAVLITSLEIGYRVDPARGKPRPRQPRSEPFRETTP